MALRLCARSSAKACVRVQPLARLQPLVPARGHQGELSVAGVARTNNFGFLSSALSPASFPFPSRSSFIARPSRPSFLPIHELYCFNF